MLTHALMELLGASAPSRVVNICSALGELMGTCAWDDLT